MFPRIIMALALAFALSGAESPDTIAIENGNFKQNGKYTFFLGPVHDWDVFKVSDRTGEWSRHRAYKDLPDTAMLKEFGMNTWQPQTFLSYYIFKKYFPEAFAKPRVAMGSSDYFGQIETEVQKKIKRMSGIPLVVDFSDVGLWCGAGAWAKNNQRKEYFQKTAWWHDFFPFDPSYPQAMDYYKTMFYEGTKFLIDNGASPFIYELGNEVFYNSFSPPNIALFETWLEKKHGSIGAANAAWGGSFASYKDAAGSVEGRQHKDPGLWYDWMSFQSELIASYTKQFKETVLSADKRPVPKYFTVQPHHQVFSMNYANAFNNVAMDFLDVICTEYTGLTFSPDATGPVFDGKDMMAAGFTVGNDTSLLGAALAKAYAKGRPIIDNETRTVRHENGVRVPSWDNDYPTTLWTQIMFDYSQSILYTWGNREWEWNTYAQAMKSSRSDGYKEGYLLNPFNYPEKALFGLKRFRDTLDRISDVVMPCPRVVGRIGMLYLDHQSWQLMGREKKAFAYYLTSVRAMQITSDFIIAEFLTSADALSRFEAVICPVLEFCPASTRALLKAYVERGGTLICAPESFTHDEYGKVTDSADILGLSFGKMDKVFVDNAMVDGEAIPGRYDAVVTVNARDAAVFAKWQKNPGGLVYKHVIGKGAVYTLACSRGDSELSGVLGAIFRDRGIERQYTVSRDGKIDKSCTIDPIDRGDKKLIHVINWTYLSKLNTLSLKKIEPGDWHLYNPDSGNEILPPSGTSAWSSAELAAGITVFLPAQESALFYVSRTPPSWKTGSITSAAIAQSAEARIAADIERYKAVTISGKSAGEDIIKRRTFTGLNDDNTFAVDLSGSVNMGFADETPNDGAGGASDQGPLNDLSTFAENAGRRIFYGVPYTIIDPAKNGGKSMCVLKGGDRVHFPTAIENIKVDRIAAELYFLHATAWTGSGKLFSYSISYDDGSSVEIPVEQGKSCEDWWSPGDVKLSSSDCRIAWTGKNRGGNSIGLYSFRWKNPSPDKKIASIAIISAGSAVPMVVAVTGAVRAAQSDDTAAEERIFMKDDAPKDYDVIVFNGDSPSFTKGDDGLTVFTSQPKVGQWGGFRFVLKSGNGVILPEGNWQMRFEVNYTGADAFGKVIEVPRMQLKVYTTAAEKPKDVSLSPSIDSDPATWEARSIAIGKGPCTVKELFFQYQYANPPEGVKLRNIRFVRLP